MKAYFANLTVSHLRTKHVNRDAADAILANYNVPEMGRVADRPKLAGTALELVKSATVNFVADPNIPRTADILDGGEELGTKTPPSSLFVGNSLLGDYDFSSFSFGSTAGGDSTE